MKSKIEIESINTYVNGIFNAMEEVITDSLKGYKNEFKEYLKGFFEKGIEEFDKAQKKEREDKNVIRLKLIVESICKLNGSQNHLKKKVNCELYTVLLIETFPMDPHSREYPQETGSYYVVIVDNNNDFKILKHSNEIKDYKESEMLIDRYVSIANTLETYKGI